MVRPFALPLLLFASHAQAQDVVIHRCEDAQGRLTLRDSPCGPGETQQIRHMQRPRDPEPVPATPSSPPIAPVPAPASPPPPVLYRAPPRPMYECITGEGERYTSDSGEGSLRWVPWGAIGYARVPRPPDRPAAARPPHTGGVMAVPVGAWLRDECHMLSQADTCARLSDRRYEILRRYGSAMPSEQRVLDQEQRALDARLDNDCGNR